MTRARRRFSRGECGLARIALIAVCAVASDSGPRVVGAQGRLDVPPLGLDLYLPIPSDNPPTPSTIRLGERLFFDTLLSADESIACASCHRPEGGFADNTPTSRGAYGRRTTRNAPSLLNAGYGRVFFWDGRTQTLEDQVLKPIVNRNEMDMTLDAVVARLEPRPEYQDAFLEAFGTPPAADGVARALASYVRTLRSGNSAADRYAVGEAGAIGTDAAAGFRLFRGKARCVECHLGPLLTDEGFHNTGVGWGGGDRGRYDVTGEPDDRGKFNTPSLRNVAETAPYMHDGSLSRLEDVIDFYDGGANANPNLDARIRPLGLDTGEKRQLVAYLHSLTGAP